MNGFWIHKLKNAEGGDPEAIADTAAAGGFDFGIIKILDGAWRYNQRPYYDVMGNLHYVDDALGPVVTALVDRGIPVWGYQYQYPQGPMMQAERAAERVRQFNLAGLVIDAESEMKGQGESARVYLDTLRNLLPTNFPIALSSYRYPDQHQDFPWRVYLSRLGIVMPQVYWMGDTNAVEQLHRCKAQYDQWAPGKTFMPVGSAFSEHGWSATPGEVDAFLTEAKEMGKHSSLWEWRYMRDMPGMWDAIVNNNRDGQAPPPEPEPEPEPEPPVEDDEMDFSKIDEIKAKYPDAQIVINVTVTLGQPEVPGDPVPAGVRYLVVAKDKPSKRAKVRATASMGGSEIDYVQDGEYVTGPGRTVGEFTYITARETGEPLVAPGFVETKYLNPI